MSGKGSWRSRVARGTKKLFGKATNIYYDPTKTRTQKATTFLNITVKNPATYAENPNKPLSKRIPAGAVASLGGIATAAVVGTALGVGAATATIGGITRVAAPLVGTAVGTGVGLAKGAVETPFRTTYGLLKAGIKNAPTAAFRGIKYSLAKKRFQKRTGVSNRTLSNIEHLETKESKAKTALEDLIKRQEAKLEKKALTLSPDALEKKQEKYTQQREELQAKINKRTADLETTVEKKLTKTRFSKAKRGEKEAFTLEAKKSNGESNEAFGRRIGVEKKNRESNEEYKTRLNSFVQRNNETKADYLKRRVQEQYDVQKSAYNEAITKDIKAKQQNLGNQLIQEQKSKANITTKIAEQEATLQSYKNTTKRKDSTYFQAIAAKAQAERDLKIQDQVIGNIQKKKLSADAKEKRILMTKGLNAKKQRMEKRRARLDESKQNLIASGKHFISPLTSVYYGAKTGAQIGTTIGQQALKYGTFGKVKSGSSNSGQKISKSAGKFLGMSSGEKQDNNIQKAITKHKTSSKKLLETEVESKKEIKTMKNTKLGNLKTTITQTQTDITTQIQNLTEYRTKSGAGLSISQKVRIDDLISKLRAKSMKYAEALLRVEKRLVPTTLATTPAA